MDRNTNYSPPNATSIELELRPFTPRAATDLTLHVDDHGPGVIKGRVTNEAGEPVEGVYVKAVNQDTLEAKRTQTDSVGEYRIQTPEDGTFHVMARAEIDGETLAAVSLPNLEDGAV